MNKKLITANLLLLLTAAIWGFGFAAQRISVEYIGPFMFNGIRFMLGAVSLVPLILLFHRKLSFKFECIRGGIIAGTVLFIAAAFQQTGVIYTTAGNAGFITGLYIVIVPILGYFFLNHKISICVWTGVLLAIIGLYLLSISGKFSTKIGDLYVLASAAFWALHILVINVFAKKMDSLILAAIQFFVCSVLSFIVGILIEPFSFHIAVGATLPILYLGLASTGIAYTLQIVGQKHAQPSHASIVMSMEAFFAAAGGWIILNEQLSVQAIIGCALMLSGMFVSQIENKHTN